MRMTARFIGTWSPRERMLRLLRFVWGTSRKSYKFSVAVAPMWLRWMRESDGWILVVLALRLHYHVSYGGTFDA